MKLAVPAVLAAALTMTASAALAGPVGAVEHLGQDVGHRVAQTGRAVGHEGADIGRGAGHAVAQTGRDVTGNGPSHHTMRHHRRHHRHHAH
jgi:hypothetical protein